MAEPSLQEEGPETKRRKVRKGTQSCWNCRRRKVRCIFATPTNPICNNCKRRGTACIGQEYPNSSSSSSHQVEARLGRMNDQQLVHNAGTTQVPNPSAKDISEPRSTWIGLEDTGEHRTSDRRTGIATPSASEFEVATSFGCSDRNTVHSFGDGTRTRSEPLLESPLPATAISRDQGTQIAGKYEDLICTLIAAWPSQHDLDIIYTLPVGLSAHLRSVRCISYSGSMGQDLPSPREMLQLPPPGSHPVLVARALLVLGTFLQGVHPSIQDFASLRTSYRDIMARVVDRAIRLVTTNDDLVRSVEGIECIMIEAIYQNYAGNLHQAWMAVRRGTAIAQLMALHRGLSSPSLKILEPQTRAIFNSNHIFFRLIEMDRYLSLMLGLPQAILESRFAIPKALEGCHPIDRIQRIHCAVAGRILQRNDADVINLAETQEIDKLLQKAAAEMLPQWWLIPNLMCSESNSTEVVRETTRLMDQFTHHHLLIRLHLPYMLCSSPNYRYDSSITAVTASRETLNRFVAFRTSNSARFYCRGCDFLAFIAITVLCIAHIDSCSQRQGPAGSSDPSNMFNFLAHSRPSNRGIMERTLDIIESMSRGGTDLIASKLARIIHHLLDIEANAASGTRYTTNSSKGNEEELECDGKLTHGGKALHVYIPHLGAINFERGAISRPVSMASTPPKLGISTALATDKLLHDQLGGHSPQPPSGGECPLTDQIGSSLSYSHPQTAPFRFGLLPSSGNSPPVTTGALNIDSSNTRNARLSVPEGFADAEDDWDLQGIDTALFDSLFRGIAIPDADEEGTWMQWPDRAPAPGY